MSLTILITGGAGFIGSHTADRLLALGHHVRVLDNLQKPVHLKGRPAYLSSDIEFIKGDVRDREAMYRALQGVDIVFHLAAYQDYLQDFSSFFHTNAVSTALLYELIVEHSLPIQKVIVASSQFVQGEGVYRTIEGEVRRPTMRSLEQLQQGAWDVLDEFNRPMRWSWTPESHANPPNAYAMSKYSQEMQALRFGERYNIPSVALRYSIVQGSRQSFYNTYSGACRIFSLHYYFDRAPTVYEDGAQLRDFVNIHDVVDANMLVMDDHRANYQVFCVGGGVAISVLDFARTVARVFDKEHIEPRVPGEFRLGDTRHTLSDISRLRSLGWQPTRTIEDSVREYAEYLTMQDNIDDLLDYAEQTMKQMNVVQHVRR